MTKPVAFGLTCHEVLDAVEMVRLHTDTDGLVPWSPPDAAPYR